MLLANVFAMEKGQESEPAARELGHQRKHRSIQQTGFNAIAEDTVGHLDADAFARLRRLVGLRQRELRAGERILIFEILNAMAHHSPDIRDIAVAHGVLGHGLERKSLFASRISSVDMPCISERLVTLAGQYCILLTKVCRSLG